MFGSMKVSLPSSRRCGANHTIPRDQADYDTWNAAREWFANTELYEKPIVRFDFDDSE